MVSVDGLKISIHRGDTGSITVTFTGQDTPPDGTVAIVGLKKTKDSEETVWEKPITVTNSQIVIPLFSEDTNHSYGKYYWGLRLMYENGDIYTPMAEPQEFRILPAVPDANGGEGNG